MSEKRLSGPEELKAAFVNQSFTDLVLRNGTDDSNFADGCIILGQDGSSGHRYLTRYRIDHIRQRAGMGKDILREECVPCLEEEARETVKSCVWNFIQSEAFLFTLHLTALALGVIKEAMDLRKTREDLELVHSLIETVVTMLMITIRMAVGWLSFKDLKSTAYTCEHLVGDKMTVRGHMIKHWRNLSMLIGCTLLAVSLTCFLVFYFFVHLGWTILSNNFCMVVFTVFSGLYMSRVSKTTQMIRDDQQKAVLYESLLLLKEAYGAVKDGKGDEHFRKVSRFIKALNDTAFLEKPNHIVVADPNHSLKFDMLTAMEMQTNI